MSKPGPEATKSRKSIEAWRAASIRGFDDEFEDMDCGICLDAHDEVRSCCLPGDAVPHCFHANAVPCCLLALRCCCQAIMVCQKDRACTL